MNPTEAMRTEFEAYFKASFGPHFREQTNLFIKDSNGEYVLPSAILHWEMWQLAWNAATKVAHDQSDEIVSELVGMREDIQEVLNRIMVLVNGHPPDWSNHYTFQSAIDDVDVRMGELDRLRAKVQG